MILDGGEGGDILNDTTRAYGAMLFLMAVFLAAMLKGGEIMSLNLSEDVNEGPLVDTLNGPRTR